MIKLRLWMRVVASVGCVALPFALGACGTDEDGDARASDAAQLRKLLHDTQSAFLGGDGEALCSMLTAGGRKEMEQFGVALQQVERGAGCPRVIRALSKQAAGIEQKPARVVSTKIDGNRATMLVSDGGRPPRPMKAVRVDGGWKLPSVGIGQLASGS